MLLPLLLNNLLQALGILPRPGRAILDDYASANIAVDDVGPTTALDDY